MFDEYLRQYGLIAMFVIVAVAVPIAALALSYACTFVRIRASRPTSAKLSTYECGMRPVGSRWMRFNIRYYYYAVVFVVFDVETVFLYPWAARYGVLSKQFGFAVFGAMMVFLGVVTLGYVYAWRKGALEWVKG
ncbi:MAG: NADH-quinone oxidoreductase subunit A [Gemmatimonadetes bacterium]|nr:NADH-quinone oxidoreductase subunit A [Gemmatimonadota bacterium]